MSTTNLLLPNLITNIKPGKFGSTEMRPTHNGAVNVLYKNAPELFSAALIERIRAQPLGRTIQIPILDKYDSTILTARSCSIACADINSRLQTLSRTHLAVDICINLNDYDAAYLTASEVLEHKYTNSFRTIYKTLDGMAAAYVDANKDTSMTADVGAARQSPMLHVNAGAYEFANSLAFYTYVDAFLNQMDYNGPYAELTNTIANAETKVLNNAGGGAILNTGSLYESANIDPAFSDFSNRVATGVQLPVHYLFPVGTVGMLNMIDLDYQRSASIGSGDYMAKWDKFRDAMGYQMTFQMADPFYEGWDWGVLVEVACVGEQKVMKIKFSADFTFARDFTSVTGESPIKRFDIAALRQLTA